MGGLKRVKAATLCEAGRPELCSSTGGASKLLLNGMFYGEVLKECHREENRPAEDVELLTMLGLFY